MCNLILYKWWRLPLFPGVAPSNQHVNRRWRHNYRYVAPLREYHLDKAVHLIKKCINIHLVLIACLLLLQEGDVERNPGPKLCITCPNCNEKINVKKMLCECGYKIIRKKGRPIGTTAKAGSNYTTKY